MRVPNCTRLFDFSIKWITYINSFSGKDSEKNVTLSIFEIQTRLLDGGSFRRYSFNDRFGYYFHDYSMIPLMIQACSSLNLMLARLLMRFQIGKLPEEYSRHCH